MPKNRNSQTEFRSQINNQTPEFYKRGFYSVITSLVSIFVGLFQFVVFSRYLSTELYGYFNQIMMITQLFMFLTLFGTDMALKQIIPPIKKDKNEVFSMLSSVILFELIGFIIVVVLFLGFPKSIEYIFLNESFLVSYFPAFVGLIFIFSLGLLSEFVLHIFYKFKQILFIYLVFTIVSISLILFIIISGPSIQKIIYYLFFAFGVKTFLSLVICLKTFKNFYGTALFFKFNLIKLKTLKKIVGIYFIFGFLLIADNILRSFDKLYISANLSTESYAIYSFYYSIAFLIAQLTFNIKNFLNPYVREHKTDNRFYFELSNILIKFSSVITGAVITFKWIIWIIVPNPDYQSNTLILDLLLLSFYIYSINLMSQTLIFSKGKHVIYIIPILISLILIYIVNLSLIKSVGIIIPPISMIISYSIMTVFYSTYLYKVEKIQMFSIRELLYLLVLIILIIIPNVIIQVIIYLLFVSFVLISEKKLIKWIFKRK